MLLNKQTFFLLLISFISFYSVGCSKSGELSVTMYGEEYIEEGIPASAFDDGWNVTFQTFEVGISQITAQNAEGKEFQVSSNLAQKINLISPSSGAGQKLLTTSLPEGTYSLSFILGPIHVVGTAEKEGVKKNFDWNIQGETLYRECTSQVQVSANKGAQSVYQITIHADHLFFDSLIKDDPKQLFGPFAQSDVDEDGLITEAELKKKTEVKTDLPNITNQWEWLQTQSRTIGHVNGESHCKVMLPVAPKQ